MMTEQYVLFNTFEYVRKKYMIETEISKMNCQQLLELELLSLTKGFDFDLTEAKRKWAATRETPPLYVHGCDAEQIWQQIELKNNEKLSSRNLRETSRILANRKKWGLPLKLTKENSNEVEAGDETILKDIEQDIEDVNFNSKKNVNSRRVKKKKRISEVDDKFFHLDELDEYLRKEDEKAVKGESKNDDSSDEDSEFIDLFENLSDLYDSAEDEEDFFKNAKALKYADFFDSPESDDEYEIKVGSSAYEEDDEEVWKTDEKQPNFNLNKTMENFKLHDQDDIEKPFLLRSAIETVREKLRKRIEELEAEAIAEMPWQLKGETNAANRPQNSLLEEFVEFDNVSRPAPVMTEQTTMKLEDIIRRRIKDKTWDDVEKKFKPVETPLEYKKKLIMNQEKSKESLAQIYENEYIKQREALNEDDKEDQEKQEPPEHIVIKEKMHSLFTKLDALSNFHYTPKPAKPEIKIISNLPAISMEEVAPVATSEATLLAPEEVQSKHKGELIGKSERSKTDKKRERRKKKRVQHLKVVNQHREQMENALKEKWLLNSNKSETLKGRNIINVNTKNDSKPVKSSTAFFAQLQDQVESSIKAKASGATTKKKKDTLSAVKLKL